MGMGKRRQYRWVRLKERLTAEVRYISILQSQTRQPVWSDAPDRYPSAFSQHCRDGYRMVY